MFTWRDPSRFKPLALKVLWLVLLAFFFTKAGRGSTCAQQSCRVAWAPSRFQGRLSLLVYSLAKRCAFSRPCCKRLKHGPYSVKSWGRGCWKRHLLARWANEFAEGFAKTGLGDRIALSAAPGCEEDRQDKRGALVTFRERKSEAKHGLMAVS